MEHVRHFIAGLQKGSLTGLVSHLCGPRNSAATPPLPEISSSDMISENSIALHLPDGLQERDGVCGQCGRVLNPPGAIVFVLGAPGTGKGTQCAFLAQEFGFRHLSYGDLCRRLGGDSTSFVSKLDVKKGSNNPDVPDDLGAWLVWKEIRTEPGSRWLIDGFPRRVKHLTEFLKLMPAASLTLIFDCPQDVSVERVAKRGKMARKQARPEDLDTEVSSRRITDTRSNMEFILDVLAERKMKFKVVDTDRSMDLIQDELRQIMSSNGLTRY